MPVAAEWIVLAEVDRPRGLSGEVVATLHADGPESLEGIGEVEVVLRGGSTHSARVEGCKRLGDRVVLKLSGVGTVEQAEALRGAEIRIAREFSKARAPGSGWFAWQIEGLRVEDMRGEPLGRVSRVLQPSGQTLLEVEGPRGVFLVPLVAAICKKVDVDGGRIVIDPPEGLIDLNAI